MSFLRIAALWALPLVLAPIIIHLMHWRRHPTQPWAAMMFLKRATQMRRGPAKLRRWLILVVRTLVVAAVVFAIARPLSSGKIGLAAGRIASGTTSIVVLDRSPSMQRRMQDGSTRQSGALRQIADTLTKLQAKRIVLIESVAGVPLELSSASALNDPTLVSGADSAADLPQLLLTAVKYLQSHDHPTAEIWICSDRRAADWNPDSPLWQSLAEQLAPFAENVRIQVLGFEQDSRSNTSITVSSLQWIESGQGRELAISIAVQRDSNADSSGSDVVPVRVYAGGVTSTFEILIEAGHGERANLIVPGSLNQASVYGRVSLDADVNAADDQWYFAASAERKRPIRLLTESSSVALQAACDVLGELNSVDRESFTRGDFTPQQTAELLDRTACVIWQGELPTGKAAEALHGFLHRGGSVVFFPPHQVGFPVESAVDFQGVRWGQWTRDVAGQVLYADWQTTLLSRCPIIGDVVRIASFSDQETFIGKLRIGKGSAWFCGADVVDADGIFVKDGVILFGLLADAIDTSLLAVNDDQGLVAGKVFSPSSNTAADENSDANVAAPITLQALLVSERANEGIRAGHQSGVYSLGGMMNANESEVAAELQRVVAVNRPALEDDLQQVSMDKIQALVPVVPWNQVILGQDADEVSAGLVREIWGACWVAMIIGMLGEAWLCLPSRGRGITR